VFSAVGCQRASSEEVQTATSESGYVAVSWAVVLSVSAAAIVVAVPIPVKAAALKAVLFAVSIVVARLFIARRNWIAASV
jgi:hypothetical protein